MGFAGKAALVAGAGGGGMGLAVANGLIAEGANVTLADLKPAPDAVRVTSDFRLKTPRRGTDKPDNLPLCPLRHQIVSFVSSLPRRFRSTGSGSVNTAIPAVAPPLG